MQMFDRIIPAQSLSTLWTLALGMMMALAFSLVIKLARTHSADHSGKQTDLTISGRVFAQALSIRLDARPRSTGSFMAQLREIDAIRELITSTTTVAVIDIPFADFFSVHPVPDWRCAGRCCGLVRHPADRGAGADRAVAHGPPCTQRKPGICAAQCSVDRIDRRH
jgi:hypothetical protein